MATETAPTPVEIIVKGNTTEQVLRAIVERDGENTDPIITELVARFDAKALRRAAKVEAAEEA